MLPLYAAATGHRKRRERSDSAGEKTEEEEIKKESSDSVATPSSFICLLTGVVMHDPVLLITGAGRSYERMALEHWLANRPNRDPATNIEHEKPLSFVNNRTLKDAIDDWLTERRKNNKRRRADKEEKDQEARQCSTTTTTLSSSKALEHHQETNKPQATPLSKILTSGRLVTASSSDVRLWDTRSQTFHVVARLAVTSICSLAREHYIALGCMDGCVRVIDIHQPQLPPRVLSGHRGIVWTVASLTLARHTRSPSVGLVSGAHDATLRLWREGEPTLVVTGHRSAIRAVCLLPSAVTTSNTHHENNSTRLASASIDKTVCIWCLSSRQQEHVATLDHPSPIYSLAAYPNSDRLATGADAVRIWCLRTYRLLRTLSDHTHSVYALCLLPDASTLLSGSNDKTARLSDTDSGNSLGILQGHTNSVDAVAVLDQNTVVTGSWDQSIKFFAIDTMECIATLQQRPRAWLRACLVLPPQPTAQGAMSIPPLPSLLSASSSETTRLPPLSLIETTDFPGNTTENDS